MNTKRVSSLPAILFTLFAFSLLINPPMVQAQEIDATPTLEPTQIPTEIPTTEPSPVSEEPTSTPEIVYTPTVEPTLIPSETPVIPTETFTQIPTAEPVYTETLSPTPFVTESATPTTTSTNTKLPPVVPLIQPQGVEIIPGRYIVVYKTAGAETAAQINDVSAMGVSVDRTFSSVISGFSASLSPELLDMLRQDPDIAFIEADQVVWLADDITINSIQSTSPWGLDRIDQQNLPLDGNYTYYQSGAGVHVYLMDSGIDTAHPDFGGRASNDFDTVDGGMTDCNGHGTHVAGIIGSNTYGVAKAASIHSVRVTNCEGKGSVSSIIAAVDWITANHVKPAVVNLSYVSGASDAEDLAINRSIAAGITYIAAAGNENGNACQYSPARIPGVITVGASDVTDTVTANSNQGSCLDIFAPGSDITSTSMGGGVEIRHGTSMAAPHAAGATALFLQSHPSASSADVTAWLISSSTKGVINGLDSGSPNRLLFTSPLIPDVPPAPVLVRPANGAISNLTQPIFTWKMASTADSYTFQLSKDFDFATILKEETGSGLTYSLDTSLPDGSYFWRVRAANSNGDPVPGTWSEPFVFKVDTQGPAAPTLISPANEASPVGIPVFSWQPVTGTVAYQFEVDDSADFSSPILMSPDGTVSGLPALTKTSYLPSGLPVEIPCYWHVRGKDSLGNWGEWSDARTLIIQTAIPVSPVQLSPAVGASFKSNPTLAWNSVPGGVFYDVQVSQNAQFSGVLKEDLRKPAGTFSHTITASLSDGTWYWRVRAVNSTRGAGNWSVVRSFIMDTTGPTAPILLSPLTDNTPLSIPVFTWNGSTDSKSYLFEIGTSTDNGLTISPLTDDSTGSVYGQSVVAVSSFKPVKIPKETLFYWHVRAFDALGNAGDWSESRTISLQSSLPAVPVQVSPAAGAAVNVLPVLTWNAATTAETYEIQISNSAAFPASSFLITSITDLNKTPDSPLSDGIWYWRVRGRNHTGGAGSWSAARSFVMDTQSPVAPVPVSPVTGYLFTTPVFSWKVSLTATGYQFEYGSATDATIATFSPLYTSPVLTTVTHTPPTIPVGDFYWHVRARDAAGNWSAWSDLRVIHMNAVKIPAPKLISPVSGSSINSGTPVLTWNCASGAIGYIIQISDNLTFSGENMHTLDELGGTCTAPVMDGLLTHNGKWYWRVAVVNVSHITGDFGQAANFTYDNIAPSAPVLVSPADHSVSLRAIPTFSWTSSVGANAYQFQIDDNGFTGPVFFSTPGETVPGAPITATSFIPANLKPMVAYSWRVRARDEAQNWGDWSPVRSISLLPAIPAAPVPVNPATGFLTNDPRPSFTWNGVFSGEKYHIQLDKSAGFTTPLINETLGSSIRTFLPVSNIPDGLYYWRVQGVNVNDEPGMWSAPRTIIIDTQAPPAPKPVFPANNANTLRATPVFSWAAVTGANAYQFELDDESGFIDPLIPPGNSIPGTSITTISYKTSALSTLIPYFWRVRARDAAGNWGMWSDTQTFTILPLIPAAPIPVSPSASFYTRTQPTFTWSATALAVDYILEVDDDVRFLTPNFSEKIGNVLTFTPSSLPPDGLYYWRVRAVNANNEAGPGSAPRSFFVDTMAPAAPNPVAPLDNAKGIRTIPFFTWSIPAGAKSYQFQMDDNNFSDPEHVFYTTPGDTVPGVPLTTTYAKPATLSTLKEYQWRVRACDAAGNWGSWSAVRTITLQPSLPPVTVLQTPVNGFISRNANPVFTVKETASILRYEVEITPVSPAGSAILIQSPSNAISYTGESLKDGRYSWRARMVNAANEAGAWSGSLTFTIDTLPPDKPILKTPVNGSADGRVVPVFTWGIVPGAKNYHINIDDDADFSSPLLTDTSLTVTAYKPANLTPLIPYYWRVRAVDTAGNESEWSETFTISLLPTIPGIPVQKSPANGQLINDPTPEFRWNTVTGAVGYEFQLSATGTFSSSVLTGNVTSYTPPVSLDQQGKYFWHVRALNAKNEPGTWSPVWNFSLDTVPPEAPVLTAPAEDALLPVGTPVFSWKAPFGASAYQFEYDNDADFSSPVYTSPDGSISGLAVITLTSVKPPAMAPAVPYYWHVRARDAAGNWGDWSTARRITIQESLPGIPVLSFPADKAFTTNRRPVFGWASTQYGFYYEIQVSRYASFTEILKDEVTISANQLTLSFADDLPIGDLYWRVRALNVNGKPGNWSLVGKLTVLAGYEFTADSTGWLARPGGLWIVEGGSMSTPGAGAVNAVSSAVIDGYFSEFTYEARVRMGFDAGLPTGVVGNDHGLILFGSESLTAQNDIVNGYYFHIGQKMTSPGAGLAQFGIDQVINGVKKPLTGIGYLSGPVNFNGWNALKVVSRGTTLTFFINNIQVYTLTNTSFNSGRLGVYSVSHADPSQIFSMDWARLSAPE